jgi:alcohol dehydrogenase (cytochrome c)
MGFYPTPLGWRHRHGTGASFSADHDGTFLVADSTTGKKLYEFPTGSAIYAPPTTYLLDGRQYVVMPSGATLTAFALPK